MPATQDDVDRIHAYRLLAHAEIQNFIEDLVEGILAQSENMFDSRGHITHAAHHLVVYDAVLKLSDKRNASEASYPMFSSASIQLVQKIQLESAVRSHRKKLKLNSGVKASNLRPLLGPLGYRDVWFPLSFMDQMDAFGASRGDVAHSSGLIGASQWPSGSSELATVKALQPGLKAIDVYAARVLMPV
ncbi:hypothetical protein [Cryobacterium sp. BB736]|uniref:hypothetical protein n=1 Tax=Cryobacterium sp. BB736 TaxID=2746963 RepID=UPI00187481E6|nr:hypothetical protein [Cryobacterium sp. BB736]